MTVVKVVPPTLIQKLRIVEISTKKDKSHRTCTLLFIYYVAFYGSHLDVRRVVAAAHPAVMIGQRIELVELAMTVVLVGNIVCEIEAVNGKVYKGF